MIKPKKRQNTKRKTTNFCGPFQYSVLPVVSIIVYIIAKVTLMKIKFDTFVLLIIRSVYIIAVQFNLIIIYIYFRLILS